MGQGRREQPERLAEKLRQIREALDLTQYTILDRLDYSGHLNQGMISAFERGVREPSLPVILKYARLAGVVVDVLIDDEMDLPEKLPVLSKNSKKR
jgi:transcriptional regulator with XRE-family HTH domain